jgi:hypothetical protein
MSENTRKINIDLETFKIPSGNKTRKKRDPTDERKLKVRTPPKAQNKSLKRNLLKFIRNQQDRKMNGPISETPLDMDFKSDFKESLEYLSDVAKKNDIPKLSYNKTIKNLMTLPVLPIINPIIPDISSMLNPSGIPFTLPQPKYGCLKGGRLPLYKQYTRKQYEGDPQQFKNAPVFKPPVIQSVFSAVQTPPVAQPTVALPKPPSLVPSSNIDLGKINMFKGMADRLNISDLYKPSPSKKRRKTTRRTYKIGKSKNAPKVSVLISNRTIRNQISNKSQMLKLIPIHDIKKYLCKNGFIKVGSIAPNDVLRKMYETAMLACGEIHNYNPENLVYNYFNNELHT